MKNMDIQDVHPHKKATGRMFQACIILNVVLGVVILVLVCVVAAKVITSGEKDNADSLTKKSNAQSLREMYPGYFRSPSEQALLESIERAFVNATYIHEPTEGVCDVSCSKNSSLIPIGPGKKVNHACCESTPRYVSPNWKVDIQGQNRTMATYTSGNEVYRQFFFTERCRQVSGCTFCTCERQEVLYQGVYDNNGEYGVSWFAFDGCCKCLNR